MRMPSEQAHGTGTRSGNPAGRMRLAGSGTPKSMAFAARMASGSAEKSAASSASFRSAKSVYESRAGQAVDEEQDSSVDLDAAGASRVEATAARRRRRWSAEGGGGGMTAVGSCECELWRRRVGVGQGAATGKLATPCD
jgi:hypothetical protein